MSEGTHPMCQRCWRRLNDDRRPAAWLDAQRERCCWCGDPTDDGIYVREDPRLLPAHSEHQP